MNALTLPVPLKGGMALSKDSFHKDGRTFLKRLQNALGVQGKVKSNRAGPIVYGDIRLTAEAFEVVLLPDGYSDQATPIRVLYRALLKSGFVLGMGVNQWTTLKEVEEDPEAFLAKIKSL